MGKGLAMITNDDGAGFSPSFPTIKAPLPIHCWKHLLNMILNQQGDKESTRYKGERLINYNRFSQPVLGQ